MRQKDAPVDNQESAKLLIKLLMTADQCASFGILCSHSASMGEHAPSHRASVPTPISVVHPSDHPSLLPSAIPILRSFAALQETSQHHAPPDAAGPSLSGTQTTPPTPAVAVFRTPSRTRLTSRTFTTPAKSSDGGYGYGTLSVPPTPGSFRSFRRDKVRADGAVRRLSEMRRPRDDDEGLDRGMDGGLASRGRKRSTVVGDEEDEAAGHERDTATFPRNRVRPSLRNSTRSPSAASDASHHAEGTQFSLPRLFRTVSRQASSVFVRPVGREYDDDLRQRTPGHSRAQSVAFSRRSVMEGEDVGEQVPEDGIRVWYS